MAGGVIMVAVLIWLMGWWARSWLREWGKPWREEQSGRIDVADRAELIVEAESQRASREQRRV